PVSLWARLRPSHDEIRQVSSCHPYGPNAPAAHGVSHLRSYLFCHLNNYTCNYLKRIHFCS
ncbi:hypothetical protein ACKE5U_21325, partial [Yersinia enterocolitica]